MLARTEASTRRYCGDSPLLELPAGCTEHIRGANDVIGTNENVDIAHDAAGGWREALGIVRAALEKQAENAGRVECIKGRYDFRQGELGLRPVRFGHALQSRKQLAIRFQHANPARKRCKEAEFPPLGIFEHAGLPPRVPRLARLAFFDQVGTQEVVDVQRRPAVLDREALHHVMPLRFLSSAALTTWRYP